MLKFIAKRFLWMIPSLFAVSFLAFVLIQLPPGDYVTTYIATLAASNEIVDQNTAAQLRERFGLMTFVIRLTVEDGRVLWPIEGWRFLGIPMPRVLAPKSETVESVDADGRFTFDVGISLPIAGPVVRYSGWLEPA